MTLCFDLARYGLRVVHWFGSGGSFALWSLRFDFTTSTLHPRLRKSFEMGATLTWNDAPGEHAFVWEVFFSLVFAEAYCLHRSGFYFSSSSYYIFAILLLFFFRALSCYARWSGGRAACLFATRRMKVEGRRQGRMSRMGVIVYSLCLLACLLACSIDCHSARTDSLKSLVLHTRSTKKLAGLKNCYLLPPLPRRAASRFVEVKNYLLILAL